MFTAGDQTPVIPLNDVGGKENELLEQAQKIKLQGKAYSTVKSAIDAAKKAYKKNDLILIGGSTFVVGDALAETTIS